MQQHRKNNKGKGKGKQNQAAEQTQQQIANNERQQKRWQKVNRAEHEKIVELVKQFPKDMEQLSFDELLSMRIVAGKPVISLCVPKKIGKMDWESDPREAQAKLSHMFDGFKALKWHIVEQRVIGGKKQKKMMKLDLLFDPEDEENEVSGIVSIVHLWVKCKEFINGAQRKFDRAVCKCGCKETTEHFIFECKEYETERNKLREDMLEIYYEEWTMSSMLFPMEKELVTIKEGKERKSVLKRRVNILYQLQNYVAKTGRFFENQVTNIRSEFLSDIDVII